MVSSMARLTRMQNTSFLLHVHSSNFSLFRRCHGQHGTRAQESTHEFGAVPGGSVPARAPTPALVFGLDAVFVGLRPGGAALRRGGWLVLPASDRLRSGSSPELGGEPPGRSCGGEQQIKEQQHRRPEAQGEEAPGGAGTREAAGLKPVSLRDRQYLVL